MNGDGTKVSDTQANAKPTRTKNSAITLGGVKVEPGQRKTIDLVVGKLYTHSPISMPVQVLCGRQAGPVMFVSAAIHGDELNGVEIIRRLLKTPALKRLKGTLIAVPIVNLHGFIHQSRYLPDRRDLNRSFPGSEKGSLAARVARLFLDEVVSKCTHGIDLHTGAVHRSNLPQIRANLDHPQTLELARAFGTPVVLNSDLRDGSLREAAGKRNIPVLLYEAGEALRFDELSIRGGVQGILRVMRQLDMLPKSRKTPAFDPIVARSSAWVRAPQDGVFRASVAQGQRVMRDQTLLGVIADPFGEQELEIWSPFSGIVIGQLHLPLVNEGEALFHIARFNRTDLAAEKVEAYHEDLGSPIYPVI